MAQNWRGGRVVEGTGLENRHPCKRIVGSPCHTAGRPAEWRGESQMNYVLCLFVKIKNGQIYTYFTENFRNGLKEHRLGKVSSTSKRLPIDLIHYEAYLRESDARRREKGI